MAMNESGMEQRLLDLLERKPVSNVPRPFEVSDYEAAVAEYLRLVEPLGTLAAVYQFGSFGAPGLSDIDLIAVFKTRERDFAHRYAVQRCLTDSSRYLFSHDPLFTDAKGFKQLFLWFPVAELTRVAGSELEVDATPRADATVKLLQLAQLLSCMQLQLLGQCTYFGATLDLRITENLVKAVCNSIVLLEKAGSAGERSHRLFVDDYLDFRSQWFKRADDGHRRDFLRLVARATMIMPELQGRLASELEAKVFTTTEALVSRLSIGPSGFEFSRDWTPHAALESFLARGPVRLPAEYATLLAAYTDSPGRVGRHLRQLLPASPRRPQFVSEAARQSFSRHLEAVETACAFVNEKFRIAPLPFISFYMPPAPSRLPRLFHRIVNKAHKTLFSEGAG